MCLFLHIFFLTAFGFAAFRRRAGVEPRSGFSTVRTSRPRQVPTSLVLTVSSEAISFRGTILCRIILTWGNVCARGCVSPFPLAKPPRSSGGPITVVWLSRLLRYRFCASPRCGRGHVSFVSPGRRPRGFSARAPRAGFFRPASPFLARLYPFESAVHRVVVFVRVRRSMPWLVHLARPPS